VVTLPGCVAAPANTAIQPAPPVPTTTADQAGGDSTGTGVPSRADPNLESYRRVAAEMQSHFDSWRVKWYPRCVDSVHGGFGPQLKHDFTPAGTNTKFLVYQARMTWTAAAIAEKYPALSDEYLGYARHGIAFLDSVMWDRVAGGLYWHLQQTGVPITADKHAYGIAFGIYAAAAVARVSGDSKALDLAKRSFDWLDRQAHDSAHGGYFEALARNGTPRMAAPRGAKSDPIGTEYGRKSMNTHLHLLEAFSELYRVHKNATVEARLREVLLILRDRVTLPDGHFALYFEPDWTPIPGIDSYGHDVEGGFLIAEAAALLGMDDGATDAVVRKLEDHALKYGWDDRDDGFYDSGPPNAPADHTNKVWWTQAEGLNGMLLMHRRHPDLGPYYDHFEKQWAFIRTHVIDPATLDWWGTVGRTGEPKEPSDSGIWKETYHDGRALMTSIEALGALARGR
jgi:mannobiose 2-epimerase